MFGGQAIFCACLGLLFRLPRRVPFASVQKEPKDSPRHPAPAASRLGCPRCIVAPGGTPPRSFVDRGGSRGILPLVPLRNDSARPPDGAGLPPHHLEGKPHFVDARCKRAMDLALIYAGFGTVGLHVGCELRVQGAESAGGDLVVVLGQLAAGPGVSLQLGGDQGST